MNIEIKSSCEVLEKTLYYDNRIEKLYQEYIKKLPLDLEYSSCKKREYWVKNNLFCKIDLSRIILLLQNSKNLDDFIKKSTADFDNLAQIINLAVKYKIIKISKSGNIYKSFEFHFTQLEKPSRKFKLNLFPKSSLNQFPCNESSRIKRALFLKSRYPFAEYLKFAIIGEDDFLSAEFVNDCWAWPIIIEKDKRILNIIKKISSRFEIIEDDVCNFPHLKELPEIQTFITDPPYTLNGSLSFIYAGLKMLKKGLDVKEFYVILNPTIMGKHFFTVQKVLSESNIYLTETINNFSQYKLPDNFQEKKRAVKFLKKMGLNNNSLIYSSSSNMYIFKTISPNLTKLKKQIGFNKIYQHYL